MLYYLYLISFIRFAGTEMFKQNDSNILYPIHGPIPPNVNSCFIVDEAHALSIGPPPPPSASSNKDMLLLIAYALDLGLIFVLAVIFRAHVNLRRSGSGDIPGIRFAKGPLGI
ncbi:hypothetical protein ACQ4LE_001290 [Meloidogyne hapla]|uniref:Uncharacterized protein n=1 Tax=Meloidogyne hapla TaxID=6305 RepID=A0A1I8BI85_MELHA